MDVSETSDNKSEQNRNIYNDLGPDKIREVVRTFYGRAFSDPIIGHFFHAHSLDELVEKQTGFAIAMLGGPRTYTGKPLAPVHHALKIRPPHFGRRQVLMRDALTEHGISTDVIERWLDLEESLRPLIIRDATCR